jgi:hypothetical protein
MYVLNAGRSSEYFDSLVDEREKGAVSVIHGAWVEHSSSLGTLEHLEPISPLDMLVLYQAAAATFRNWSPTQSPAEVFCQPGRVINWEQAREKLLSVQEKELAALATRFANRVISISEHAAAEQDLNYYVELFLHALQDNCVIDGILNGSISRHSRQLTDPDYW